MFLSKLFSIFKRKKDDQNAPSGSATGGPVVSPSAAMGGAVGLGQPSQPVQPSQPAESTQTEAPSPEPEIAQADTPAPTAPSFSMPSDNNKPAEADNTPPAQPTETQFPSDDQQQPADDIQDTTIGGSDDTNSGMDDPLGEEPTETPVQSDEPDMGVATPPPSDDNNQIPTV
jgi:hypothetical protein